MTTSLVNDTVETPVAEGDVSGSRRRLPVLSFSAGITGDSPEVVQQVADRYPVQISGFLRRRIENGTYSLEAARQYLPDARELDAVPGWVVDPCNENGYRANESVIHKYPNRVAILLTNRCLVYCRYCFRKDVVGQPEHEIEHSAWDEAVEYVAADSSISDVLVSGGDPLALPNRTLIPVLRRLAAIEHLKVIRIHSRAVSVTPDRFDDELVSFLEESRKFWVYGHMNHPDDVEHPEVEALVERLNRAGVPVLNQAVILGGVNDDPETMSRLFMSCYQRKIIPYNLYALDRVQGATHFHVPAGRIASIAHRLGLLPGPAQPTLVVVDHNDRKRRLSCDTSEESILRWLEEVTAEPERCHLKKRT